MKFKILILSIFFTQVVWSAEWSEIEGIYALTAKNLIDPAENEQKDSHFRIQLTGSSAKDLYTSMKTDPVIDECTGGLAKNINDMQCLFFMESDTYECHFSINISKQKIEYGVERWPQEIGQRYKWISGLIYAMLMATISGGNHAKKTTPESLTGI